MALLCLYGMALKAQNTFAPVGAEWWYGGDCRDYDNWCESGIWWADHMQSVSDTTLLGKPARMLVATRHQKGKSTGVTIGKRDSFFVYDHSDTVFVYDKVISNFTPLYVFNVAVGDTVCLRQPNSTLTGSAISPEFCIIIDSIRLETYGSQQLKSYYNHTVTSANATSCLSWGLYVGDGANPSRSNAGKYTEKIGGNWPRSGSFFPEIAINNPDYYKNVGFPTGTFRCYSDAAAAIKSTTLACDTVISPILSIPNVAGSGYQVSVFPNPSSGIFRLSLQKPLKEALLLQVRDISGRWMASAVWSAGDSALELDLKHLSPGIYLLQLQGKKQRYFQKLMIRR